MSDPLNNDKRTFDYSEHLRRQTVDDLCLDEPTCDCTYCNSVRKDEWERMPTGPWVEGDEFTEDGYHLCECDVKPGRMQYQVAFAEDGEAVNSVSPILRHAKINTEVL